MQINLDPTRWMVALVGFVVDWVLTREWKKIALNSIPLMFLALVGILVFAGSRLDKHKLAQRYLALGEKEIAEWEESWAPSKPADDKANKTVKLPDSPEKKELTRFAEVLFRRVQLLEPNERSQFVIAVTMAQRGATSQAEKMLSKIAPNNKPGYAPAHAWIVQNMLQRPINEENIRLVVHHLKEAVKWDRVPEWLLLIGSDLFFNLKDQDACLDLLKKATELNPANSIFLAQRSTFFENLVLAQSSWKQAETYFRSEMERDPTNLKARLGLSHTLLDLNRFDEAEQVVRVGMEMEPSPALTRELSEVYLRRYRKSLKRDGENCTCDLQMLDAAMRTDPTNAAVGEEIAKLARFNGTLPSQDLIKKLQEFLAEGKATAATHVWISELYLIQKNYKQAMPHLEQVISRLPNSAQHLNNLAFIIDEIAPERREEALGFAQRAVQIDPRSADYYDTLAKVLVGLDRRTEAITALESAIERQPQRKDFHVNIIKLYEADGNTSMAEQHRVVVQRITENEARLAKAQAEEQLKSQSDTPSAPKPESQPEVSSETSPEAEAKSKVDEAAPAPEAAAPEAAAPVGT